MLTIRTGEPGTVSAGADSGRRALGVFLLSLATLLLELALTRVLSVALWYHFGFLVVSTALLGFGASGVILAVWRHLREDADLDTALVWAGVGFGLLALGGFWAVQRIPVDPLAVLDDRRQLLFVPLASLVLALPFFCSGLALALLFTRGSGQIHRLYAADLAGAAAGCGLLAVVMPWAGGSGTVVAAAGLGLMAAATFGLGRRPLLPLGLAGLGVALLAVAPGADRWLPIRVTEAKVPLPYPPIHTAWNTFSRIDVIERPARPDLGLPAMRRFIFDLGTAATGSPDLRPDVRSYLAEHPADAEYRSGIAYVGKARPSVLVLGSGGGAEVVDALHFGARAVTAVEINPIITSLVRDGMRDFWGGLFQQPEVRLVTEEGRSFVRRSRERYDAIVSVHTISNAAVASGALALSEDHVLTREAFEDYLDHLTPDGVIHFTRPEPQLPRLVATAREALTARGIPDAAARVVVYRIRPDDWEREHFGAARQAFEAGLLVKRSPFTEAELAGIGRLLGVRPDSGPPPAEFLYAPLTGPATAPYVELLTTPDLPGFYRRQTRQLQPATDDRPFFNHHTRWRSLNATAVTDLLQQKALGSMLLGDRPLAEVALLVLLLQTGAIAAVLMLLPLWRGAGAGWRVRGWAGYLAYFGSLGFGFIAVEIALLSQFTLFIGQPVYTYAVVLASLLLFTGLGSGLSGRFARVPHLALGRLLPLAVVLIILLGMVRGPVFAAALGWTLPARIGTAMLLVLPLGIVLGMLFPLGLWIVAAEAPALVPWAWGVNGFLTVIGTVAAQMLGMTFGFTVVLAIGAAGYLGAWLALRVPPGGNSQPTAATPAGGFTHSSP